MGGALIDFLLGAAVIALPQHQVSCRCIRTGTTPHRKCYVVADFERTCRFLVLLPVPA